MRCLSIRQPWAFLVCAGVKPIENRSWSTTHRGTVAVHASSYRKAVDLLTSPLVDKTLFTFGAIIGVCDLANVVPYLEVSDRPWAEGPYCFLLQNARLFSKPIPHKGRVNLCELPNDVSLLVEERMQDCVFISRIGTLEETIHEIGDGPIDKKLLRKPERHRY